MTSLYATLAKLIAIALVVAGIWFWGHHIGAKGVQTSWDLDKAAQQSALLKAQGDVIQAEAEQAAIVRKAEEDHEKLVADNAAIAGDFAGRVRSLESALRLRPVPSAVGNPGGLVAASPGAGSDSGIADSVDRLNAAIGDTIAACQHDASELTGILSIIPH